MFESGQVLEPGIAYLGASDALNHAGESAGSRQRLGTLGLHNGVHHRGVEPKASPR